MVLTRLAIPKVGQPEIVVIGVNKGYKRGRAIHAQSGFPPVSAAFVLVVDYLPDLRVCVIVQLIHRAAEQIQHIMCDGIVKGLNSVHKEVRDGLRSVRGAVL